MVARSWRPGVARRCYPRSEPSLRSTDMDAGGPVGRSIVGGVTGNFAIAPDGIEVAGS